MKKVLVMCKGTGQSIAFKKATLEFTEKNTLDIEWIFANENQYGEIVEKDNIDLVLISPEMLVVDAKVKKDLDLKGVKYYSAKGSDFGLRRIDTIVTAIKPLLG
ncbi:hypothetical protein [Clostridium gasigenes]|uniref:PTS system, cellobiose-specific IIB component n=1 Tax=Clostridium gasigenes TaxID=94869 RepID=A0A1H0QE77_9CLOT|nr:hypothetical protein [Clostridium gasigenes]MBB6623396.1 hypothetical protein [Clostridium gasigenes]MBU3087980.1 hypothetical protein [Clostridium gasigenes]MBU3133658.1 hypothetical protein [Clostridium gasigenes]SDP15500.1 PTS system, cellobiose-specific IIB component [Clostridium gasigenes]